MNLLMGTAYMLLAVVHMFKIYGGYDLFLGMVLLVEAGIYFFGFSENPAEEKRKYAHTYVGGIMALWLSIYVVLKWLINLSSAELKLPDLLLIPLGILAFVIARVARRRILS
ncbi:MAG: hypothetical protein J7L52_06300 [Thermotogae bacterium]|nr:hypothetical protein [Thermotogota bacterium]